MTGEPAWSAGVEVPPPRKPARLIEGQCWTWTAGQARYRGVLTVAPERLGYPRELDPVWLIEGLAMTANQANDILLEGPTAICVFDPWFGR